MHFSQMYCAFQPTQGAAFRAPKETIMLQELRHRFARWLAYRQTLARLREVPDSTLADNGIPRDELRQRARNASLRR